MQGFTFVAFITDVFAEYIVGLWVSSLMEMTLVLDVREQKLWGRRLSGSIRHSDKRSQYVSLAGFAPIFPDICYHLPHYRPAAADIPVASDNPAHYADAIRYNARTPLQGSLLPLTRLVWA
ncbi:hypothetical protein NB16F74_41640 [Escherichia coli]|nr:putative prophage side tail fiber protein [Escherichia coli]SRY19023.1 putative prophage side tail fiber protein [Escherichia coli]